MLEIFQWKTLENISIAKIAFLETFSPYSSTYFSSFQMNLRIHHRKLTLCSTLVIFASNESLLKSEWMLRKTAARLLNQLSNRTITRKYALMRQNHEH